jgi:hypothetical protein
MPSKHDIDALKSALDEAAAILTRILSEQGSKMSEQDQHRFRSVARGALQRAQNLPKLMLDHPNIDWVGKSNGFLDAISRLVIDFLERQ